MQGKVADVRRDPKQKLQQGLETAMQLLEGPTPMRFSSAGAGAALAAGSIVDAIVHRQNHIVQDTAGLLLRGYVVAFGLMIVLNELKSVDSPKLAEWRDMVFQWMPFLSVAAGKGLFMILASSVGLAFNSTASVWIPSLVVFALGCVYVLYYLLHKSDQDNAISESMQASSYAAISSNNWV